MATTSLALLVAHRIHPIYKEHDNATI